MLYYHYKISVNYIIQVAWWLERWTCDQQVVSSNPTRDKYFGTGQIWLIKHKLAHRALRTDRVCHGRSENATGRLRADCLYTPGSAPGPTLGNEYGKPLPFFTFMGLYKTKPIMTKNMSRK